MGFEFYRETNFNQTDLGPLPQDWQVVRLGDVIEPERIKMKSKEYKGDIPIVEKIPFDKGEIILRQKNQTNTDLIISTENTSLVMSKINFHQGAIALLKDKKVAATTHYEFYKVKSNSSPEYLWRYLRSNLFQVLFQQEIKYRGFKKEANFKFIKDFFIPLPPLPEQQTIAEVLQTIQEAREKTEAIIKATRELKKSMMKHLFTYGNVPLNEIDEVKLKETEIGPIPEHWKVVRLGEVCDFKNGINFNSNEKGNKGILTIDVYNMYNESIYIDTKNLYRVNKLIDKDYFLTNEDILFVRSSLKQEGIGWASIGPTIYEPITFCGFIIRGRKKNNIKFNSEFLVYYLRSEETRKRLISSSGKVAITNINQGMLGNILIPLPTLSEQQAIANILQAIDNKIQKEEARKKAIENLFKSMLDNLMSGKIRVRIS